METSGGVGLAYSFNVLAWLCMCLIVALALYKIACDKHIVLSPFEYCLLAALICLLIPFFYGAEFSEHAIPRYLGACIAVAFIIALQQLDFLEKKPGLLLGLALFAICIQVAVGLFQLSLTEYFAPLDFDPSRHRVFGLFYQPNVMASFIATGLAICCYLLAIKQQLAKKWLLSLLLLIAAFTILLTDLLSLTGKYGAVAALIFITPLFVKSSIKRSLICYLVIIISVFTTLYVNKLNEEPSYIKDEQRSVNVRKTIYSVSTKLWLSAPLTGVGYGSFERRYLDFHNQLKRQQPDLADPLINLNHPHNETLLWTIEGGVIPFLGFLILIAGFIFCFIRSKDKYHALACFGLLAPIALHTQTEMPFYSSVPHLLIFALLLSYFSRTISNANKYVIHNIRWFNSAKLMAILVACISTPFLLTTLHTNYIVTQYEKSDEQTLDKLTTIINPLPWRSKIEAHVFHNVLFSGMKNKNTEKVKAFAQWAEQRIKHAPRKTIYRHLLLCYQVLGDNTNYQRILQQAKLTYPLVSQWTITGKEKAAISEQ
ncbi:PglL family O-oligosaccharyltransferase [Thalassotalea sediminis]|uniref:PglL family O-oligosaccharyltransferase n=1 Tax=Thalassotalea sediminis TaxID=1759089 RepID=UPI0025733BAE|nr:Wzy polymerase domain-containing protein [Thalassotalea sediminis]